MARQDHEHKKNATCCQSDTLACIEDKGRPPPTTGFSIVTGKEEKKVQVCGYDGDVRTDPTLKMRGLYWLGDSTVQQHYATCTQARAPPLPSHKNYCMRIVGCSAWVLYGDTPSSVSA